MPRTLAAVSSFSTGRALSFSALSTSSLSSLNPYSNYVGVIISLNNSPSLSFLNVYALPICSSPTDGRTDSFFPSILPSSRNLFILGDFNCHHSVWDSIGTYDPCGEEVFDGVISSDLLPLNDPDIPTLLHCSSGSCSSPDIFFALSSLALSCTWEVLQDLGSDHLPILLSFPLSLRSFAPTSVPVPSTFIKLAGMTLPSTLTFIVLLQRNTRLFLFPLLPLSLPLWHWMRPNLPFLSAASNAILKPGGLLEWKVRLVKDARLSMPLTKVIKIARLTSPLLDAPHLSSLRQGRSITDNLLLSFAQI